MERANTTNKEEIVKAAQHVFARYGFRKTTMEEIAAAAHRAKSSLYYYFKSKDEVFRAVADKEIVKWKKKMLEEIKRAGSPQGKLSAYVTIRVSALSHLSAFYSFFADEYYENYRLIERVKYDFDRKEREIVKEILEEGIEKGVFGIDDVEGTVSILLYIVRGLEHFWLEEKSASRLKKHIDSLISLFLRGLLKRQVSGEGCL